VIFETATSDLAYWLGRCIHLASRGGWSPGLLWEKGYGRSLSWYELEDRDWVTERTPHPDEWGLSRNLFWVGVAAAAAAVPRWSEHGLAAIRIWHLINGRLTTMLGHAWAGASVGPSVCVSCRSAAVGPLLLCASCGEQVGFHAIKPTSLNLLRKSFPPHIVVGVVTLHGRIAEHRHGYRAEYARIRELWIPDPCGVPEHVPVCPDPCGVPEHVPVCPFNYGLYVGAEVHRIGGGYG
jgi:hypothetical protein